MKFCNTEDGRIDFTTMTEPSISCYRPVLIRPARVSNDGKYIIKDYHMGLNRLGSSYSTQGINATFKYTFTPIDIVDEWYRTFTINGNSIQRMTKDIEFKIPATGAYLQVDKNTSAEVYFDGEKVGDIVVDDLLYFDNYVSLDKCINCVHGETISVPVYITNTRPVTNLQFDITLYKNWTNFGTLANVRGEAKPNNVMTLYM